MCPVSVHVCACVYQCLQAPLLRQLSENFPALLTPLLRVLCGCPLPQNKAVSSPLSHLTYSPTGQPCSHGQIWARTSQARGHCPPPHAHAHLSPHSPWGIRSLGLCLDGRPRAPQKGLGNGAHGIVVVAVERGAVARGGEGAVAPRGRSAPRGAQVVAPAGARDRRLPVGVGGRTGWSRDVRETAVEKGNRSAPARAPTSRRAAWRLEASDTFQVRGGGQRGWGRGQGRLRATHRSEASSLLMYSSRMLVSMLDGSRAPLMSWPAGERQM